jgi:hypothetical protein
MITMVSADSEKGIVSREVLIEMSVVVPVESAYFNSDNALISIWKQLC